MDVALPQGRFQDDGRSLVHYLDRILVRCPKCGSTAHVTMVEPPPQPNRVNWSFSPRQLTCTGCTVQARWQAKTISFGRFAGGAPRDPYFGLPLRLQTTTRHGVIYAYNGDHLDWIEAYVGASLRERRPERGELNRSVASRLPQWVKLARNREDVLRALARLRRRLAG